MDRWVARGGNKKDKVKIKPEKSVKEKKKLSDSGDRRAGPPGRISGPRLVAAQRYGG